MSGVELPKPVRAAVENATVQTSASGGGQGVLVPGGFILTAAHCITYTIDGRIVLGDWTVEVITTRDGRTIRVAPLAVEPVADIAALGALDSQAFPRDAEAFEAFCEATPAVPLSADELDLFAPVDAFILSHKGTWLEARAECFQEGHRSLAIDAAEQIEGGTSGGPIVNARGELLGVVSNSSETGGSCNGFAPRPLLSLPAWIARDISAATRAQSKRAETYRRRPGLAFEHVKRLALAEVGR